VLITDDEPAVLLMASGSEVHVALQVYDRLQIEGIPARVISMPSWELFELQSRGYKDWVFPPWVKARVAVEAGVKLGWERYLGEKGEFVGMSSFGASAPADDALKCFGVTADNVIAAVRRVLG
jgi:transketolase